MTRLLAMTAALLISGTAALAQDCDSRTGTGTRTSGVTGSSCPIGDPKSREETLPRVTAPEPPNTVGNAPEPEQPKDRDSNQRDRRRGNDR
jgi:hypothetical protein